MARKITEAQDKRMDRRAGIKEGSARDNALDRKRGLPIDKPGAGNAGNKFGPKNKGGFPKGRSKSTRSSRANPFAR